MKLSVAKSTKFVQIVRFHSEDSKYTKGFRDDVVKSLGLSAADVPSQLACADLTAPWAKSACLKGGAKGVGEPPGASPAVKGPGADSDSAHRGALAASFAPSAEATSLKAASVKATFSQEWGFSAPPGTRRVCSDLACWDVILTAI
mmetsp:Transcript_64822/g.146240  ORF Transcript_64822/g.146240 Transcript_64822/m.146240 type:complete len:146 (+) Transcript_64822:143-580(+)